MSDNPEPNRRSPWVPAGVNDGPDPAEAAQPDRPDLATPWFWGETVAGVP